LRSLNRCNFPISASAIRGVVSVTTRHGGSGMAHILVAFTILERFRIQVARSGSSVYTKGCASGAGRRSHRNAAPGGGEQVVLPRRVNHQRVWICQKYASRNDETARPLINCFVDSTRLLLLSASPRPSARRCILFPKAKSAKKSVAVLSAIAARRHCSRLSRVSPLSQLSQSAGHGTRRSVLPDAHGIMLQVSQLWLLL
jgi:hypothetical protein